MEGTEIERSKGLGVRGKGQGVRKIETHLRPMTIYLSHLPSGGVDRRWAGCETGLVPMAQILLINSG